MLLGHQIFSFTLIQKSVLFSSCNHKIITMLYSRKKLQLRDIFMIILNSKIMLISLLVFHFSINHTNVKKFMQLAEIQGFSLNLLGLMIIMDRKKLQITLCGWKSERGSLWMSSKGKLVIVSPVVKYKITVITFEYLLSKSFHSN